MIWGLVIASPAVRDLKRVPRLDLDRIIETFDALCINPYGGDVKLLRGADGTYRRRVGVWRILFELDATRNLIVILAVKRRTSNTY